MNISTNFFSLGAALALSVFVLPHANAGSVAVGNASFQDDGTGTPYPNAGSANADATLTDSNSGYYEQYDAPASDDTSILGPDWSVTASAGGWNLIEVDSAQTSTTYNNRFTSAGTSDGSKYAFLNLDTAADATITPARRQA